MCLSSSLQHMILSVVKLVVTLNCLDVFCNNDQCSSTAQECTEIEEHTSLQQKQEEKLDHENEEEEKFDQEKQEVEKFDQEKQQEENFDQEKQEAEKFDQEKEYDLDMIWEDYVKC
ncbi:unnamed protein product [Rotaria sp. Silwood1]|nr:unnamed protein product [Rotaria sp. Silwood1]